MRNVFQVKAALSRHRREAEGDGDAEFLSRFDSIDISDAASVMEVRGHLASGTREEAACMIGHDSLPQPLSIFPPLVLNSTGVDGGRTGNFLEYFGVGPYR